MAEKFASENTIQAVINETKAYTNQKIVDLVGTAPEALDTIQELATAMQENQGVVAVLDVAIGQKANKTDLTTLETDINAKLETKVDKDNIPVATTEKVGGVKPDGTTLIVNENGVLTTTVDSELSNISEKPVQNKVIKIYIDDAITNINNNIRMTKEAIIGTASDTADSNTIKGAKAYADSIEENLSLSKLSVSDIEEKQTEITNDFLLIEDNGTHKIKKIPISSLPTAQITYIDNDAGGQTVVIEG